MEYNPIPETAADALAKWDAGETVFSVEMGGLGPGYEMCIQALAFEMIRELVETPPAWDAENYEPLNDWLGDIAHRCSARGLFGGGYSGAQVGAAKSLAAQVCRRGYRVALSDPDVKDRLIQVSRQDVRAA